MRHFLSRPPRHYIKENLRIKYYGRCMDDRCLIHESREYLKECLKIITELCAKLKITASMKKTRVVKLKDGMDFLKGKYVLLEPGKMLRLPGRDSAKRMRRKLKKFKPLVDAGEMGWAICGALTSHGAAITGGGLTPITECAIWTGCIAACSWKIYPQEGIMVCFWKKNGQVYHHAAETRAAAMKAAKLTDGLAGQLEAGAADEEFEAGGCLSRNTGCTA